MQTHTSRVTSKGQVVIPKSLRLKFAIAPETVVRWIENKDGILMIPESKDPIQAARGMIKKTGLLKALRKNKQDEKRIENRKHGA